MATLYTLLYGKSKRRLRPIMTDVHHKCQNYLDAREHNVAGWHKIVPAEADAVTWRQKSATVGGNRCEMVDRVGHGRAGWIGKSGFQEHT